MKCRKAYYSLALVLSLGGIGVHDVFGTTTDNKSLIVPGKSIGQVRIGAYMGPTYKRLGRPNESEAAAGNLFDTWYSGKYKVVVHSIWGGPHDHLRQIVGITVNSPYFRTREGLGVGSTQAQIRRHFPSLQPGGTPIVTPDGGDEQVYRDNRLGLGFTVRRTRTAKPSDAHCIEVDVYTPSEE